MVNAPAPPYVPAKYTGGPQRPDRIVLHSAVCDLYPGAALAIARYGQNPDYVSSWHYTVDNHHRLYGSMGDSATYQCVWDETTAWHDGDNHNSLGIEMCERPSQDIGRWNSSSHRKLMENTAALVRQLCLAYDIPMRWLSHSQLRARHKGIVTHDDVSKTFGVSSHWDPGAFPKDEFMAMVNEEDDMPSAKEIVDELLSRDVFEYPWKDDPKNPKWNFRNAIESIWRHAYYGWGDIVPSQESGKNTNWYGRNALGESVQQGRRIERNLATVLKAIEDSANGQPVDVDEAAIAESLIASLTPDRIAAAISDDVAAQVVDELNRRLAE